MLPEYKDGVLSWGGVNLEKIAQEYGTPLFAFSADVFSRRIKLVSESAKYPHLLCFSMKSNNNYHLLNEVRLAGAGVDVVSYGEFFIAQRCGIDPKKIVFSGVGKSDYEITQVNNSGILLLNIESESEYRFVKKLFSEVGLNFGISFRVKFELSLDRLHPYLGVGKKDSKFGISEEVAFELYEDAVKSNLPVEGLHFHIGSQIKDLEIFYEVSKSALNFVEKLEKEVGVKLRYVDVGGGLGLDYENLTEPPIDRYTDAFKVLADAGYKIIFELGRFISAPAGVLITKVLRKKKREGLKNFLVVDAGMTELLRIPLYKAYHKVIPVRDGVAKEKFDIVGPICENSDYILQDVFLADVEEGEFLCVLYAGAYTSTMLMNYNGRPFPAEVVIKDGKTTLARERGKWEDLIPRPN